MAEPPRCAECHFSDVDIIDTVEFGCDQPHLICRRLPPTMVSIGDAAMPTWPLVHDEEWCGEFKQKAMQWG